MKRDTRIYKIIYDSLKPHGKKDEACINEYKFLNVGSHHNNVNIIRDFGLNSFGLLES